MLILRRLFRIFQFLVAGFCRIISINIYLRYFFFFSLKKLFPWVPCGDFFLTSFFTDPNSAGVSPFIFVWPCPFFASASWEVVQGASLSIPLDLPRPPTAATAAAAADCRPVATDWKYHENAQLESDVLVPRPTAWTATMNKWLTRHYFAVFLGTPISRLGPSGRTKKYPYVLAFLGWLAGAVSECTWVTEYHFPTMRPPGLTECTSLHDTYEY